MLSLQPSSVTVEPICLVAPQGSYPAVSSGDMLPLCPTPCRYEWYKYPTQCTVNHRRRYSSRRLM